MMIMYIRDHVKICSWKILFVYFNCDYYDKYLAIDIVLYIFVLHFVCSLLSNLSYEGWTALSRPNILYGLELSRIELRSYFKVIPHLIFLKRDNLKKMVYCIYWGKYILKLQKMLILKFGHRTPFFCETKIF